MACPKCGYDADDEVEPPEAKEPAEPSDDDKQEQFAAALMRREERGSKWTSE